MHNNDIGGEALYNTFFSLKAEGRFAEAGASLVQLLQVKPEDPALLFLLGSTLYLDEQYAPALNYLNKAIAINPAHATASLCLFHTLASLNKWPDAFAELSRFLSIEGTDANEHLLLLEDMKSGMEDFPEEQQKAINRLFEKFIEE